MANNKTDNNDTSYINMASAVEDSNSSGGLSPGAGDDPTLIGKHCEFEYCNQLDFLPFFCQSCRGTFCLDHRSEGAHQCREEGAWAARRREAALARPSAGEGYRMRDFVSEKPCADDGCKTVVGTSLVPGVHCATCNRDYCLKHRLQEDHDCKNKEPIGARPAAAAAAAAMADSARKTLDRFRLWNAGRKEKSAGLNLKAKKLLSSSASNSNAARLVDLNTLKKTAKGDAKLAPERRVYLHVEAEAQTTKSTFPKGEFFYSKDWVVGRLLDAAARSLQVENINNQSDDESLRLRVFHVEGGRLLDFNEKVGASLATGNTIVLLRGVGPSPDLIEV
ncbi:hypothetical protein B0T26DRAFT_744938 [Lasiosphaeria miniovina]|uniref:AN1-type domain-containing protein n=1 Tax=Lasiosphaeria miniovina TaxID=1954250 RepID=A0AA40DIJ8_9PEZI|nr:uncharacterized protein B0T26DRAFT_744938 [Lasiosphaeria miniovina]KAK0702037.1 hypothetical protein B0T26DRAFT_744938 [Lasiosphaeria miniovina]